MQAPTWAERARLLERRAMTFSSSLLTLLETRGYIHQLTDAAGLDALATKEAVTGYIGFDATAPSLHVGSLVQIMMLRRMQQTGHRPVVLMQDHGLGPSLGAIAAVVMPYRTPMLLAVHLRAEDNGPPGASALMSRITRPLLDGLGMAVVVLDPSRPAAEQVALASDAVRDERRPTSTIGPASLCGPVEERNAVIRSVNDGFR